MFADRLSLTAEQVEALYRLRWRNTGIYPESNAKTIPYLEMGLTYDKAAEAADTISNITLWDRAFIQKCVQSSRKTRRQIMY